MKGVTLLSEMLLLLLKHFFLSCRTGMYTEHRQSDGVSLTDSALWPVQPLHTPSLPSIASNSSPPL